MDRRRAIAALLGVLGALKAQGTSADAGGPAMGPDPSMITCRNEEGVYQVHRSTCTTGLMRRVVGGHRDGVVEYQGSDCCWHEHVMTCKAVHD